MAVIPSAGRYARHAILPVVGAAGQQRIANSTVLIVGCGALGSTQAQLAARAGVGKLILVDRDVVELQNLHRQLLFDEHDVEQMLPKAVAAARHLRVINSEITVDPIVAEVTSANVAELIGQADFVLDGTDNFETRYLLNDACVREGKPWVYGGVLGTQGAVMAVCPGSGPCFRCVFAEPPALGTFPTTATAGVLNAVVVWVAALQVTEMFKLLVGEERYGRLHSLDIWGGELLTAEVERDAHCPCCVHRQFEALDSAAKQ